MDIDTNYANTHGDADVLFHDVDSVDEYVRSLQAGGVLTEDGLQKVLLALTKDTKHSVLPSSLATSFLFGTTPDDMEQVLLKIAAYLHDDLHDEKFVFITYPSDDEVYAFAVCIVHQTDCTMAVSGVGDAHYYMENFLAELCEHLEPFIQQKKPEFKVNLVRVVPIQPAPAPEDICLHLARKAFSLVSNKAKLPSYGLALDNSKNEFHSGVHDVNAASPEDGEDQDWEGRGRPIEFDNLSDRMSEIDLKDDGLVAGMVASVLREREIETMALTDEHEKRILRQLPDNEDSGKPFLMNTHPSYAHIVIGHQLTWIFTTVTMMLDDSDIHEAVLTFQNRIREVVDRLVLFILSLGYPHGCPTSLRVFAIFCMANATKEHRSRLVRLLSHPSVIPIGLQYILGLNEWTADQFDGMVQLTVDKTKQFLTAYGGVAHCPGMKDFLYAGSATSTHFANSLVGESKRMVDHHSMMQKRPKEIKTLRVQGARSCLFVHEKMAESDNNWFFFPMFRYVLEDNDPVGLQKSALALFAENCMMIFLSCRNRSHFTRRPGLQWFADSSYKILYALRPENFPVPPWDGANVVLPMLQSPSSLWNLLDGKHMSLELTADLQTVLEDHFQSNPQPWLSVDTCSRILEERGYTSGRANIRALAGFYAKTLKEHGIEYENLHQRYLKKYSVLYVGIIRAAESSGLVSRSADGNYVFDAENIPWDKVADGAQSVVPKTMHSKYTAEACKSLYKSPKSAYFNQYVLNAANWEMLRRDLPNVFALHRPRASYGPDVNYRMWAVSRHILYMYLMEEGKLIESDDNCIRLRSPGIAQVNFLLEDVIQQLQKDVALDPTSGFTEETLEDESIKAKLLAELRAGFHELEAGVKPNINSKWKTLEKLEPHWTTAFSSITTAGDAIPRVQVRDSGPSEQDPETRGKVARLLTSHVEPSPMAAQASTGT
ncbi:hypothetical protein ACHAPQ_012261 [Fusarium lateritium]